MVAENKLKGPQKLGRAEVTLKMLHQKLYRLVRKVHGRLVVHKHVLDQAGHARRRRLQHELLQEHLRQERRGEQVLYGQGVDRDTQQNTQRQLSPSAVVEQKVQEAGHYMGVEVLGVFEEKHDSEFCVTL